MSTFISRWDIDDLILTTGWRNEPATNKNRLVGSKIMLKVSLERQMIPAQAVTAF